MTKEFIVNEIRRLSQEEGLNDIEVGSRLGYARGSVQRIRRQNGIPKNDVSKRKDKPCMCMKCEKIFHIRRCESDKIVCLECEEQLNTQERV